MSKKSDKKYGIAVILSAIFGVLGIHHFYLQRYLHGIVDLSMTIGFLYLFFIGSVQLGVIIFLIDVIHTFIITVMLLIGVYKDGEGKVVTYPGQIIK
jgi:TM2 domain-containing membrane protein YozV